MSVIKKIYTHLNPHLDEIVAIWLLNRFGEKVFPGISEITNPYKIQYLSGNRFPKSSEEYEAEGMLLIGTGGGRFDEHPSEDGKRKEDKCAATLVADALGLSSDPAFDQILRSTANNDLKGAGEPMGMAHIAKVRLERGDHPGKVMEWVFEGLDAMYENQKTFHHETAVSFANIAEVKTVPGPKGEIKVAIVRSDNPQMSTYARSLVGGGAAIVLQLKSTGHIAVMNNQKLGLKTTDLIRMIRVGERQKNNVTTPVDWKTLEAEGNNVEGAEVWWYQLGTGAILNGSPSVPNIAPTKLTVEEIFEMVKIAMDLNYFEPSRSANCLKGKCTSSQKNPCPLYNLGLTRCRVIRAKNYEERKNKK